MTHRKNLNSNIPMSNKEIHTGNRRDFKHRSKENNINPKEQLDKISDAYLTADVGRFTEIEMEAKFNTRGIKPLNKIDYDNVIKKISSSGWTSSMPNGIRLLRIQPEFIDSRTGEYRNSNEIERFRVEINDINNIQEYCRTNSINIVNDKSNYSVKIIRKFPFKIIKNGEKTEENIYSANFDDFNFRVSLNTEDTISKTGKIGMSVFENWNKSKKVFRYMNRVTFTHKDHPFKIELSIVKSSTKERGGWMKKTYNIDESNVFNNESGYEIEIEVDKSAKHTYKTPRELSNGMQQVVKIVLAGLQKTNYPVSYKELNGVLQDYHKLLFEEEFTKKHGNYIAKKYVHSSDFIGPNLVTLDMINAGPINSNMNVPNITEPNAYCVTEKADGDRHLLYITNNGKIYIINSNMKVMFTGSITYEKTCFNSIIDGELILHGKNGDFINTFAAFDAYYIDGIDIRSRPFINTHSVDEKHFKNGCRLPFLKEFIRRLKPESVTAGMKHIIGSSPSSIKIISKKFYPSFDSEMSEVSLKDLAKMAQNKLNASESETSNEIFNASRYLLRRIADKEYPYEIDGLIFTPTLLGVGGDKMFETGPKRKMTWKHIFKWKPSEATTIFPKSYNTIDFLVSTKKGTDGTDVITPVFEKGLNNHESNQFKQFKTLILTVGYDISKHGYLNPCQDVLDEKDIKQRNGNNELGDEEGYKPKQFFPSNPCDPLAGLCNIMLETDNNGVAQMFTEEHEIFEDQTVVEFRYDITKTGLWKWTPMRVRYDKTIEFKNGNGVGANDYDTANNNWKTIHNPITEKMISGLEKIPGMEISDDVYYNSVTADKMTQRMRNFHNLYVKNTLIRGVTNKGDKLIDLGCGKGGDFPKWINSELSFVFGIDISSDNIENRCNGACVRYLNFKKSSKKIPYALFINGDTTKNIRSGINMLSDKANQITKTIFGSTGIDKKLGPAVVRQHGIAQNGFDVMSCQFAMHYMFEKKESFYNFIRNIAECTKLNGYFISTCYDGTSIFNMLKNKELGESDDIFINEKKVWSITKKYDSTTLNNDESCLGYEIDVYQDSINQSITEYLVNFDFFTSTMDKYGFKLVNREDSKKMNLPEGSGLFSELFTQMEMEIKNDPKKEINYKDALLMKDYEKKISFLNRFFVFQKVSTRNAEKLTKTLLGQTNEQEELELVGTMLARESVEEAKTLMKPNVKKLSEKIKLIEATEVKEDNEKETQGVMKDTKTNKVKKTRRKKLTNFEIV